MTELVDLSLTDAFLDTLRRDSWLQAVQSQYTDQQLLDIAHEKIVRVMAPLMIKASKRFFRAVYDITLEADVDEYDIPPSAMGNKLHLAALIDNDGRPSKLTRKEPAEDIFFHAGTSGHPMWIRLDDKTIVVDPAPSAGDIAAYPTLRTYIHREPGRLVRATSSDEYPGRAIRVASVAAGTGVVTYDTSSTMPSDFAADSEHDFYSAVGPYKRKAAATAATAIDATLLTQTFDPDTADLLAAGDWVCLKNETCFVPVPANMVGHAKDLTIAQIARTQGDKDAQAAAEKALAADIAILYPAVADPMDENPQPLTLFHSPFLQMFGRRGRGTVR